MSKLPATKPEGVLQDRLGKSGTDPGLRRRVLKIENTDGPVLRRWKSIWSAAAKPGTFLGWSATIFILMQVLVGIPLVPYAMAHWRSDNPLRYACFLGVAM